MTDDEVQGLRDVVVNKVVMPIALHLKRISDCLIVLEKILAELKTEGERNESGKNSEI